MTDNDTTNREITTEELEWLDTTARSMARSACGTRWITEVEDATSEATLWGLKCLRAGKGRSQTAAAARQGAREFLKRLAGRHFQRAHLVETTHLDDVEHYREIAAPDPTRVVIDNAGFQGLVLMLDDERDRRLLAAWIKDRETQEEIAEREGICQERVARLIARALSTLRGIMEGNSELMETYCAGTHTVPVLPENSS